MGDAAASIWLGHELVLKILLREWAIVSPLREMVPVSGDQSINPGSEEMGGVVEHPERGSYPAGEVKRAQDGIGPSPASLIETTRVFDEYSGARRSAISVFEAFPVGGQHGGCFPLKCCKKEVFTMIPSMQPTS
jgi:hypothetical protein